MKFTFIALAILVLYWASSASSARVALTGAGLIDIEVDDFQSVVYVAELNDEGVRSRLEGFQFAIAPKHVGFYQNVDKAPLSNYSLAELGEPHLIEYTESYPNGATASVLILTVELPNGANFSYKVERWDKPTYKNYFGWKMPLDATTMKTTQYFTNIPLEYRGPDSPIKAFVESDVTIQMMFREGTSMGAGDAMQRPAWIQDERNFTMVDPSNPPQYNASILPLLFQDQRFNLTLEYNVDTSVCPTNDVDDPDCVLMPRAHMRFLTGPILDFVAVLANLENNGEPIKHITMPLFIGMNILDGSSCVWDPNLNILFAPSEPASDGANIGAIAGGSIAAVIVVVGAVGGGFAWRKHKQQLKGRARITQALGDLQESEAAQRAANSPVSAAVVDTDAPNAKEMDMDKKPNGRKWVTSMKPRSLSNAAALNNVAK